MTQNGKNMSFFRERFLSSCCKSRIFKPKVISVKVHLYDLSNGMATKLSPSLPGNITPGMGETQLTGIWHTGTVVFGQEFYYSNEGILKCTPARTLLGQPKRIIDMGSTDITEEEFLAHVEDLSNTSYRSADFHMILHNANKFTDELVFFLTGNNLPSYITFLPEEIPKRLLRFMGSIAGGVPETARVPFSPCASYTHNIDGSHMTIFTLNSLLQSGSGPDQELDPFHGTKIFPVRLYIYDLSQGIIELLPQSIRGANLTGIWHTGVVVYRLEFFFSSAGIKICQPSGTILGDPHKTADLGETFVPFEKFMTYLQHLSTTSFRPEDYSLLTHNCNTFAEKVALHLTGESIPRAIIDQTNEILNSPLVTQFEGVVSDSKLRFDRFMTSSLSAMSAMSIKDFIVHRHSTGKIPFVDDN